MIKKILPILLIIAYGFSASAQTYVNDWIDYSKQYFRVKVFKEGIYRIDYNTLLTAFLKSNNNLNDVDPRNFQLFYNGVEQYIYVKGESDGMFKSSDFIEFYGEPLDGTFDTQLFGGKTNQNHDKLSLFSDTAVYFLTWGSAASTRRMAVVTNDTSNLPSPATFCFYKSSYWAGNWRNGIAYKVGNSSLFSSEFEVHEGWITSYFTTIAFNRNLSTPFVATTSGESAIVRTSVSTKKPTAAGDVFNFSYRLGHTPNTLNTLLDTVYSDTGVRHVDFIVNDLSWLAATTFVQFQADEGKHAAPFVEIEYPRSFIFNNAFALGFRMKDNTKQYLEISGLLDRGTIMLLHDLTNHQRMEGIKIGTKHNFVLPQVSLNPNRDIFITTQDANEITFLTVIEPTQMVDYGQLANEGDFIIITHPSLMEGGWVDAIKAHKRFPGGWDPVIVMIDDIYDQFSYGIQKHPQAIRNFLAYTLAEWSVTPEYVFLIGKGVQYDLRLTIPAGLKCLIPTWGHPASDVLLAATDPSQPLVPQIPIGRIAATNSDEVEIYYKKILAYEAAMDTIPVIDQTLENKLWQKRIVNFGGGKNASEQSLFKLYLNNYANILEDNYFGGDVTSFFKTSTDPFQQATSALLDSLINTGVGFINFFGHASTNTIEFNLTPENFLNKDKYHFVLSNSCLLGQIHSTQQNMSERFVFVEDKGAIGFLASVFLAIPASLDKYTTAFCNYTSVDYFGKPSGFIMKKVIESLANNNPWVYEKYLLQQNTLHGDPSLPLYNYARPDYAIERPQITFNPTIISAKEDSFDIIINVSNLGKAVIGDYDVQVIRTFPDGTDQPAYVERMPATKFQDLVTITIIMDKSRALGLNTFTIKVDAQDEYSEISEFNNELVYTILIISEDLIPVSPFEFAIVDDMSQLTLKASTANSFASSMQYVMQIDTTMYFNSPLMAQTKITRAGGVFSWKPPIANLNNTVYYWRATLDTLYGNIYNWNSSSFTYISGSDPGWNQAHFFQYLEDVMINIELPDDPIDPNYRRFKFVDDLKDLRALIGSNTFQKTVYYVNEVEQHQKIPQCAPQFIVAVLDSANAIPKTVQWNCFANKDKLAGEFNTNSVGQLDFLIQFLDTFAKDGDYVVVMGYGNTNVQIWDSAFTNSAALKLQFMTLGADSLDQLQDGNPYLLIGRKNDPSFITTEILGVNPNQTIDSVVVITGQWNEGSVASTRIGPSLGWNELHWAYSSSDAFAADQVSMNILGIDTAQNVVTLASQITNLDTTLTFINAAVYPYLQLQMVIIDDTFRTPPQIDLLQVLYDPVPEGALNAALHFEWNDDTLDPGETMVLHVPFENIGNLPMDSVLVKYTVIDAQPGNVDSVFYFRMAPLPVGDTIHLAYEIDTKNPRFQGLNTFIVEANPDNDQPEQTHFNNVGLKQFFIKKDNENPILDVTFDGRHILDGDIVSAHPMIVIQVTDENAFLPMDDTSKFTIRLMDPSTQLNGVYFASKEVNFYPASVSTSKNNNQNKARVEYNPRLIQDGIYQLQVEASDKSNNAAGDHIYRINFEIINKPMVSNVLNYPNPFSTATRFVFTLTGSEVPTYFKIQIMTVTGKIVREITQLELGPIIVGNNYNSYVWNGTDQYGDRLANGIYLYRVVTNIQGNEIDHYKTSVDYMFKSGFGKMYLIR